MTEIKNIQIDQFNFECFFFKGGSNYLIGFNGFGEDAEDLKIVQDVHPEYSLIAINLPFHGNTSVDSTSSSILYQDQLKRLIATLIDEYKIDRFSLFGYSLGAKIVLCLLEIFPQKVEQLIMFAPDGLHRNKWYNLVVSNRLLRSIFKGIIKNPSWFFKTIKLFKRLGILPKSIYKFILFHLETEDKRHLVYDVWFSLQLFIPNIKVVQKIIQNHSIEIQVFFGSNDRIIRPKSSKRLLNGIENHCKFKILDSGHRMLTIKNLKFMQ